MCYSVEPRDICKMYVKRYGFLSFAKNFGTNATKVAIYLSNKYSQKLLDSSIKIHNRCNKNCFKETISKHIRRNW